MLIHMHRAVYSIFKTGAATLEVNGQACASLLCKPLHIYIYIKNKPCSPTEKSVYSPFKRTCLLALNLLLPSSIFCLSKTDFFHFLLYVILKIHVTTWKLFYFITTPKFFVRLCG